MKDSNLLSRFEEYLMNRAVNETFSLMDSELISFHWANWDETCVLWQNKAGGKQVNESGFRKRRELFEQKLLENKNIPVWIKTKTTNEKIDLYQLYKMLQTNDERYAQEGEVLVSLHSDSGPYVDFSSMRWFDPNLYKMFVYSRILDSDATLRKFRFNSNIPVICKLDHAMMTKSMAHIHQISDSGIIIKISGKPFLDKILNSKFLELNMDLSSFKEVMNLSFEEGLNHLNKGPFNVFDGSGLSRIVLNTSTIERYNNRQNLKRTGRDQYFIFARFDDFKSDEDLASIMTNFTRKGESFLREGLKKVG